MGDFHQDGDVATFHDLSARPVADLEERLRDWASATPMGLMIPALATELDGTALPSIVDVLTEIDYLHEVVIGLDRASPRQFEAALDLVAPLPMRHRVIWNDGPRVSEVGKLLEETGGAPTQRGKGHNVWYGLGYLLGTGRCSILSLHDADILTYSRDMLARLLYPVAHPDFGYGFAKGYYFRADGERLNGRVARLLVAPLLRALEETLGPSHYIDFIGSFRYPLAGESAMRAAVALKLRLPYDWGLEIGVLSELYRTGLESSVCQVDVADAYDHKHQEMSIDDPDHGLHRMAIDISRAFYRHLAAAGDELTPRVVEALGTSFARNASKLATRYEHDAEMNGYLVDVDGDRALIELFRMAVMTGAEHHLSDPGAERLMPSWSSMTDDVPDALDRLVEAVEADNAPS